ncbi:unnamed protein product [Phytomonas sp. EM1]|nr:unnamed protein product [Phytomonas sp. EM1]|eukprot:CCW64724.1 unnamed protein product [Phytomonas sp. isolate EM1]
MEVHSPAANVNLASSLNSRPLLRVEEPRMEYVKRYTLEYLVCSAVLIYMTFGVVFAQLAGLSHRAHAALQPYLHPPWAPFDRLGSHGVDVTDGQWYYMIVFLPYALPIMGGFVVLSRRVRRGARGMSTPTEAFGGGGILPSTSPTSGARGPTSTTSTEVKSLNGLNPRGNGGEGSSFSRRQCTSVEVGEGSAVDWSDSLHGRATAEAVHFARDLRRTHILHFLFGLFVAVGVTGMDSLFGLVFILANYFGIRMLYRYRSFRLSMAVMWSTHIAVLFLHYFVGKYRFSWFGLGMLDDLWQPLFRWTMVYNMSMLRMISFNMDLYEAMDLESSAEKREHTIQKHESSCVECAEIRQKSRDPAHGFLSEEIRCYRCRTDCPRLPQEFNLLSYLAYMFYLPLFLTGPMLSFNAYTSYLHHATRGIVGRALWRYALRCAGSGVLLSFLMHYAHVMGLLELYRRGQLRDITPPDPPKAGFFPGEQQTPVISISPTQKILLFYSLLGFLWLKLDFVWKLARLIALFDGVEPPEDMRRCFCNTVSIQDFWRDWHASFNMWIVRYMYIPMGGKKNKVFAIFIIFFFIAIWHDIDVKLLYWAGLTCVFFVPEIFVTSFFATTKNKFIQRLKKRPMAWRWVRIIGAQFGIMELILINLTGFMLGSAAPKYEVWDLFHKTSWSCIFFVLLFTFCGANVAVQDRDRQAHEERVLRIKYNLKAK